ncbi:alpha-N-arabinofuranosidase [Mucilaginibacter sp. AW1-3]
MKRPFLLLILPLMLCYTSYSQSTAKLTITADDSKLTISKHIYGQFSEHLGRCIYGGFWVDPKLPVAKQDRIRLDIVEALKKIKIPNLRWPGGCFADEYHWRDGIGPRAQRPKMVNTNWGGVSEDNSFGTHEFLELCNLLHTEPYIAGNVGSGTVEEMAKWVEYLNCSAETTITDLRKANGHPAPFKVTFWGVGNESWGCGGNMTPEFYSENYRRYATYARDYPGTPLKRIASGSNGKDYNWTDVCMKQIGNRMWGLTLHWYTLPTGNWNKKGSATNFDETQYFATMKNCLEMDEIVTKHSAIMDKYDPNKRVALVVDEWGIWTDPEPGDHGVLYQQNSLRDALIAASTLNIFNNHCERVKMANLAQTINVLQALILTDKEKMLLTPTYHVFDLYKVHQDAKYLPVKFESPDYEVGGNKLPALNVSASVDANNAIHISLVNIDNNKSINIHSALAGLNWKTVTGQILTSANVTDINTFENPGKIKIAAFTNAKKQGDELVTDIPPHSVVVLELK